MKFTAVQGASTDAAPAIAFTGIPNEYFLVWKKLDGTIWYSTCDGTLDWSAPQQIQGKDNEGNTWIAETDHGPAVAEGLGPTIFENDDQVINPISQVYVAWKGKSTDKIWYSTSPDGKKWTPQATVPEAETESSPSLTTIEGAATVAWASKNNGVTSWTMFPSGVDGGWGDTPPGSGVIVGPGKQAPAVGPWTRNGLPGLVFVWKDSDETLWYTNVGGQDPGPPTQIKGVGFVALSSLEPSFNSSGAGLAWKGRSEHVWVDKVFPQWGLDETQQEIAGALTNHAPAWVGMFDLDQSESGPLVFVAHNMTIDGFPIVDGQLISCIP